MGTAPMGPIEVLLVEDNPGDIRLTEMALRNGVVRKHVSVTRDGEAALAFLRREGPYESAPRPDLILLDLNLPRKSGHEVLAEIKKDVDLRCIPTVILTTSDQQEDVRTSYELFANCYITKPIGLDPFLKAVGSIEDFWLRTATLPPAGQAQI